MAEDGITTLYNLSLAMSQAGDNVKEKHEQDYLQIINYLKSSENPKERILATQLISRFFKYFPEHEEAAFDSVVDLCESADVDIRKHATMAMITICRSCKHFVSKAADILIQIYQTNEASEVNLINQSLTTLLNLDIKKFLQSFFTNFDDGTEIVRERALKFLSSKIPTVDESVLTKDVEEILMKYSKKAMEDVTKDEFITFINVLTKLKIAKTNTGQAMIVLIIKSQAELEREFDANDTETLDKFLLCIRHTIPLLSQYNRASEYINYICIKILPHLSALSANGVDLNVLRALAEMSPFVHADDIGTLIDLDKCQQAVYNKLTEYLPLPPSQVGEDQAKLAENKEVGDATSVTVTATEGSGAAKDPSETATATTTAEPEKQPTKSEVDFQFTHIEYLAYTLHQFCRLKPEFFTESLQNDIKLKLQHLALGCSKYMELLSAQLSRAKGEDLKNEENKLRSVALRTTKNISILVRDLFKKPPQFKASVLLSCKPLASDSTGGGNNTSTNNSSSNNNNNISKRNNNQSQNQVPYNNKRRLHEQHQRDRAKKGRLSGEIRGGGGRHRG